MLLLLSDDSESSGSLTETLDPTLHDPDPGVDQGVIDEDPNHSYFHISQAAIMGPSSSQTLCTKGLIRELAVSVLIDSGSSHNIIQPRIAAFLDLPVVAIKPFSVFVGNGQSIQCSGSCVDVPVTLSGHLFHIPFYVLPVHGADIILGVHWLKTLGVFLSDYNVPSIQFTHNGIPVTITGNISTPNATSYSQFCRFLFTDSVASLHSVTMQPMDQHQNSPIVTENMKPELATLLLQFKGVFDKPHSLPPARSLHHHIHLLPGSALVNVKPYRYPHSQKSAITDMIQEMLKEGIIKPSTSPFSSPVILVKKKDGSWRFCVDYRALNAITVKDRFPIPTVDELLDELHESTVYSKLDLRSGYHQVLLAPEDTFKTAFWTVDGHFEFLVMLFGLSNAPATFQATMKRLSVFFYASLSLSFLTTF